MRLIPLRFWIAGLLISSGNLGPAAADQPDTVKAVTPEALGVLTKCRGWLVTRSCRTYHHIRLPSRIAVGDTITVLFGSHPKEYRFSVARIALEDDHCTILSEANGDRYHTDQIKVPPCGKGSVFPAVQTGHRNGTGYFVTLDQKHAAVRC
jgi:hypothetical protein